MSARRHRSTIERARTERAALESAPPAGRVRAVGSHAYRKNVAPSEVANLDPADTGPALDAIRRRIARCIRAGMKAYVFIDEGLRVFVLPETHIACSQWCEDRPASFVGVYGNSRGRAYATLDDDVAHQLKELRKP